MAIKVLVFESDAAFAETLRAGLIKYGCDVSVVDDANNGLAAASREKPNLRANHRRSLLSRLIGAQSVAGDSQPVHSPSAWEWTACQATNPWRKTRGSRPSRER